ncbi:NADH-ubiquinone oxidoreductase-F iron-sulfur binding region domain-containing protein [Amycolatopsis dongchuanensis]|uniref:NADH-ubiquinone oxidoreductase-F iron-sulfur binding region domain-containing protein n=1 Tax=Amycolatopsis dongchuanensis TaxID=1070866 RepID=A0ABP9PRQ7_9PSEU
MRLLDAAASDLATHLARNGRVPWGRALVDDVREAGLTGRGGAGFPVWRKLSAVAEGSAPVVVANGAEGEPASAKDHTLLVRAPHLVLDGLQLAAEAVRATTAVVYVPEGLAAQAVRAALAERAGWDALPVAVVVAPDYFVAGQESAVVAAVEGRQALPSDRLTLTVRSGVHGRPTLVQNVETLAHVAQIARYGPEWFRQCGTAEEPGTFLATVSGSVRRGGVYEVPHGVPLGELLAQAGGPAGELRAVLVGGYHGTWVPAADARIPLSRKALGSLGAGVLVALDAAECGLAVASEVLTYLARQSARQCGPCLNGLPALARAMSDVVSGARPEQVARLADLVERRGACHHPDGAARFARSSLAVFGDEIACHLRGGCAARRTR